MSEFSNEDLRRRPQFTAEQADQICLDSFGIVGHAKPLPSERDQNFHIACENQDFVLKIANPDVIEFRLGLENSAIRLCEGCSFNSPRLIRGTTSRWIEEIEDENGLRYHLRCLEFVPGTPLAKIGKVTPELFQQIGTALAEMDLALANLNENTGVERDLKWDLQNAASIVEQTLPNLKSRERRFWLEKFLKNYRAISGRIDSLPRSVIHNDANDYNVLVNFSDGQFEIGIIDFGDMLMSTTINELAIGLAYGMLDRNDPFDLAAGMIGGYCSLRPISESELSVLFPLICMRLAQSVCLADQQQRLVPENEYLSVSEQPAWQAIQWMSELDPHQVRFEFSKAGSFDSKSLSPIEDASEIATPQEPRFERELQARAKLLAPSLTLSYQRPLKIVRGQGPYLYDQQDRTYLDCVNNVCHVGHCHPDVVAAANGQMQSLNTNTRYLHNNILNYAHRLTETLPDGLEVCFFVNSGSEANDLALRLARTFTQQHDIVCVDHAYHGHVSSLIEISPYKFNSKGGSGCPPHVHVVPMPDGFRGPILRSDPEYGKRYGELAVEIFNAAVDSGRGVAAFIAESLLGCGGQHPLPIGYLSEIYSAIRNSGGVCIADEVQVGFGRVGTHFWGFQQSCVVPDIVTMGKPIGNGHPLAAVVTTREIAEAFDNGMEYFNTFGGNPVSMAVGNAVLDVIQKEDLQSKALDTGKWLLSEIGKLVEGFEFVGDVRGSGLFLGIEIVESKRSLQPDSQQCSLIVEEMRRQNILLSADGPDRNVIKFKPPMVFEIAHAERFVATLKRVLKSLNPGA